MYQPSSIELYSMIIISSPIKLETEKGAREYLKLQCAASGQLIHRVNWTINATPSGLRNGRMKKESY